MKLTNEQLSRLCRSLSLVLHGGIPLSDGVGFWMEAEEIHGEKWVQNLVVTVQNGSLLWESMAFTGAFSPQMTALIKIGEETGQLEQTLDALAEEYENRSRLTRQIRSGIAYPAMVLLMLLVVIGVLLIKVLPVFEDVYASLGTGLTGLPGGLLVLGQGLEKGLPWLLAVLVLTAGAGTVIFRVEALRERTATWLKGRFGDRGLFRKVHNARFIRGLALGLGCGMTVEEAMELAGGLLEAVPGAKKRYSRCAAALAEGTGLPEALELGQLLPKQEVRLLKLGIRSGTGDKVLAEIAGRLEEDASQAMEDLIARVEPGLVFGGSVLVGIIVLSVMLPLLNILNAMG